MLMKFCSLSSLSPPTCFFTTIGKSFRCSFFRCRSVLFFCFVLRTKFILLSQQISDGPRWIFHSLFSLNQRELHSGKSFRSMRYSLMMLM
uniref:Secreted protein n=1 Tax=Ascaris lumbricoides TaxID=6252 RepID=A0A9J2PU93_ASCLU